MKPKNVFCINSDDRLGCKSQIPPCITTMMENCEQNVLCRANIISSKRTKADICRDCRSFVHTGRWEIIND